MIDLAHLSAIAGKHGLAPPRQLPAPWIGAASHVYPVGDMVIKIPFDRPDTIEAVTTEAVVAPFVWKLGVQASELMVFDDSREIIPVPFAVFRRVDRATSLQILAQDPASVRDAWEEVGRQLGHIHGVRRGEDMSVELRTFRQTSDIDPRPWIEELGSMGSMDKVDTRWLQTLLDQLAPAALDDIPLTLCHGDMNAGNILVDERSYRFRAIVDWASTGWFDPAWDFAGLTLDAVPFLLSGHRSIAPLSMDHTAEARICWCQVQMRLFGLRQMMASPESTKERLNRHIDQIRRFVREADLL